MIEPQDVQDDDDENTKKELEKLRSKYNVETKRIETVQESMKMIKNITKLGDEITKLLADSNESTNDEDSSDENLDENE